MVVEGERSGYGGLEGSSVWYVLDSRGPYTFPYITNGHPTELRIEWCKARARAHRWQEECLLLAEEMRRVKAFFQWEASRWEDRRVWALTKLESYVIDPTSKTPVPVQAMYQHQKRTVDVGRSAFAARQADTRLRLLRRFRARWGTIEDQLKVIPSNCEKLQALPPEVHFSATQLVEFVYDK